MIDEQFIADLKAKHPYELHLLEHEDIQVVVKSPQSGEWKRWRAMAADPDQRARALETLTRACVVYPDAAGVNELLEMRPALAETFGAELTEIAGLAKSVQRKKL